MIKTKEFSIMQNSNYGNPNIDKEINEWLEKNRIIEMVDIKYQVSINNINEFITNIFISALVIYKDNK